MSDVGVGSDSRQHVSPELWEATGKLICDGYEQELEVVSTGRAPRTEEACAKSSFRKREFSEALGDYAFADTHRPGEPENALWVVSYGPILHPLKCSDACILHTPLVTASIESSFPGVGDLIQ